MNKDKNIEIRVWMEGLRPTTESGSFQTLHSLAPARLALRATFGVASRPVTTGLGSQSALTGFREI
jgi:hypothetical protein